ncbi:hypothetical protein MMPV_008009 [Pyropia vietnamensis]
MYSLAAAAARRAARATVAPAVLARRAGEWWSPPSPRPLPAAGTRALAAWSSRAPGGWAETPGAAPDASATTAAHVAAATAAATADGHAGAAVAGAAGDGAGNSLATANGTSDSVGDVGDGSGGPWFRYELVHQSTRSAARAGIIHTPHGPIETPAFVAVATNGALKAVDLAGLDDLLPLVFCNTYHLMVHPGPEVIAAAGGLHAFTGRTRPLITDSGGFQVFSLAHGTVHDELNRKGVKPPPPAGKGGKAAAAATADLSRTRRPLLQRVTEEGAVFRSYRDGSLLTLTPESSVAAQKAYGADIIVPLDELPPYYIDADTLHRSVLLSHRWEARSLAAHLANVRHQAMYCVLHGGIDRPLRTLSAEYLTSLPFDGWGIGGSLGKNREELLDLLRFLVPLLPADRPNHLLGIADVESIASAVPLGVDTFDSCFPTRLGRHGTLLTQQGRVDVRSGRWRGHHEPLEEPWGVPTARPTMAYLHHLLKAHEPVAATLMTLHNLYFMTNYMKDLRRRILDDEI